MTMTCERVKPYFQDDSVTIYHGDCREILPTLPQVDLVLTDPPYNIGTPQRITFDNHGDDSQRRLVGRDFGTFDEGAVEPAVWLPMVRSLLTGEGVIVSFYDARNMDKLLLGDSLLEPVQDFHWCKPNPPVPMRSVGFSWGVESGYILRPRGAKHKHNNEAGISPNWKLEPRCSNNELTDHPTQKPHEIMHWLVNHWSFVGQTILDPFMGSGTTLRAAKDLGRKAIGIEIEERYCEIAAKRMSQGVLL